LAYAVVFGVVLLLGGAAYGVAKLTSFGSPKTSPSPTTQPAVSSSEQTSLGDAPSTGTSILKVTQVIADQGNIATLIAGALQVAASTSLGGDLSVTGNGAFSGSVTAANFSGNGSGLSGVNAALLGGHSAAYYSDAANLQGTISDARLSANVALRGAPNTFSATNTFDGTVNITGPASLTGSTTISSLILGSPLDVTSGGTGLTTVAASGVLYGQGAATLGVATPSAAGQCLLSTAGAPQFGVCPGGGGGVTSLDNLAGDLTIANSSGAGTIVTIDDASTIAKGIAQFDATNFSVAAGVVNTTQDLAVTSSPTFAALTLTAPLAVSSGGTGDTNLANNGVVIGQGTGALTTVSSGGVGQCLISGAGAPSFQVCPGSGAVLSVNSQSGAVTIDDAQAAGGHITINDADAAGSKGIATFNATNFQVSSGSVNTIQDIAVGSTPTFAGLNLSAALTIANGGTSATTASGARTNLGAAASGGNSDITSLTGLTTALSLAQGGTGIAIGSAPTNGQVLIGNGSGFSLNTLSAGSGIVIGNAAGTITISAPASGSCATCANQALSNLSGVAINTSLLPAAAAGVDVGSATLPFGQLYLGGTSASPGTNNFLVTGVSTGGTRTITLPDASGTVAVSASGPLALDAAGNLTCPSCLTSGGGGGTAGVASINGLSGTPSIANATVGGSTITLNNASTTQKGIAQFNSSDFSAASGTISLGTVAINKGGTGLATTPTNGQLLIGNGSGYTLATLSNSDGTVAITNGAGSIDISVPRANQCSTCADYTLDNLTDIVAINKSLLPASAGTINLGSASVPYSFLFLSGSSATPGSNNFKLTGTSTAGTRTITLPDASGTVCLDTNNCSYVSLQGATPGSAQTGSLNVSGTVLAGTDLKSSGTLTVSGAATLSGTLAVTGNTSVGSSSTFSATTITSNAATNLSIAPSAGQTLTLGATGASQTSTLQGASVSIINGDDTLTFENAAGVNSYQVCTTHGNCAGVGGGITGSGSANTLALFNGAGTITNSIVTQDAGATKAIVGGNLDVTGSTITGTSALTVTSTGGANDLTLTSGSGTIVLGGSTGTVQRAASSLTLDLKAATTSTLTITNSNVSNVANLSVEGGVNIGSGQAYQINGNSINVGGTLTNVAYLDQANAFTNSGTTSFGGPLTGGTYNGQTISSAASFTGTVAIAGANALTLGQAAAHTGAILFQNLGGSNTITLAASDTNPASSFTLTLPSAAGNSGDCLKQTNGSGQLGFVSCSSGLGGSGTTGTIALFTGASAIGNSLLTQPNGTTVAIQGTGNGLDVDGSITTGLNGASGAAGSVVFNDGSNPGRAVTVQSQQSGSSYTLQLPTSGDVGTSCLQLVNVSAGVDKITGGSCAAGGSGGNITASGSTSGHLALFTSNGPAYSAAASLVQDNASGIGINVAPQAGYILTVGSSTKFNVKDNGQLEIGTTGSSPLTLATTGDITNAGNLTASGLLQTSANSQALTLSGAPTNSATQSLLRIGSAIASGNSSANGGTYLGLNAPSSGSGSAADFLNFQAAGTAKLRVDSAGNFVTAGTYNGLTLAQAAGQFTVAGGTGTSHTLTVTANSTIDQNLATTASPTFSSLTLTNKLTPANGGTGTDTSGASAGAALIFNATTGKFQANRITSSDASVTVTNSDGNISLQVASCSTCANTTLSNLGTTNLNASLLANTSNNVDLGSATNPFRFLYVFGASGTPTSNNFKLTGTSTGGTRTITLPDATGTVCLDTNNCNYVNLQASTPGAQQTGSLNVSGTVLAGTDLKSSGTLTVSGAATLSSTLSVTSNVTVGSAATLTASTITSNSGVDLSLAPASGRALTVGATGASQTTNLQGNTITFTNGAATYSFNSSASGSRTLCDSSGNCAGAGGGITGSGSTNTIPVFNSSGALTNSLVTQDGTGGSATTVTVGGKLVVSATNVSGNSVSISNSSFTANNASLTNLSFTNANATATSTAINGLAITPTGTTNGNANANILYGVNFSNVTTLANNAFYGLNFGTGYNDILRYNGAQLISGSGLVQNAAFDTTLSYTNLQKVGNLTATSGTVTLGGAAQQGSLAVNAGNTKVGTLQVISTLGQNTTYTLPDPAAGSATICLQNSASCGFAASSGSGNYINNSTSSQTASFNITSAAAGSTTAQIVGAASATVPVAIIKGGATPGAGADLLSLQSSSATLITFSSTGNQFFTSGGVIGASTPSTANAVGNNLTVRASAANGSTTGNNGGQLSLTAGDAAGSGNNTGGLVQITGGSGGSGSTGNGGGVTISSGTGFSTNGTGGLVQIQGGSGTGSGLSANGGGVTIQGGFSTNASGGDVTISAGGGGGLLDGTVYIGSTSNGLNYNDGTGGASNPTVTVKSADFRASSSTSTAFIIQNASSTSFLTFNGATSTVTIGTASGNSNASTVNVGVSNAANTINIATGNGSDTVQIGNTANAVSQTINIGNNNTASSTATLTVGSLIGSSTTTIQGGTTSSGNGAISIQAGSAGLITLGTANSGSITLGNISSTGTITIGQSNVTSTVNIANVGAASGQTSTVNIANTAGAGSNIVNIGASGGSASATNIYGGNGINLMSATYVQGNSFTIL
jgi:hypothetical protein